jgi:hypothetical protein
MVWVGLVQGAAFLPWEIVRTSGKRAIVTRLPMRVMIILDGNGTSYR